MVILFVGFPFSFSVPILIACIRLVGNNNYVVVLRRRRLLSTSSWLPFVDEIVVVYGGKYMHQVLSGT